LYLGTCGDKAGSIRSAMVRERPGGHSRNGLAWATTETERLAILCRCYCLL